MSKFFANNVDTLVPESIDGLLALNQNLVRLEQGWPSKKVILDRQRYASREANAEGLPVAVLCGGGSGHEPAFAGYVGHGMLSAAIAGDLFASPPVSAVLSALRNTITDSGALVVVLCYTGDRLNFGAAVEAIRAETGLDARMVIVADDVALRAQGPEVEKRKTSARGLAGAMLVLKASGAAAAANLPLDDVERIATLVSSNVTTMGVSLTSCHIPGRKQDAQRLHDDEMEYGLGAHGEPGAYKSKIDSLDTIVETVVKRVGCVGEFEDHQKVKEGSDVAVLVNNMGGTTMLEFSAVVGSVRRQVEEQLKCNVVRLYSGTFLSSLDMKGFSVSLLRIPEGAEGEELLGFLDAPTNAAAWPSQHTKPGPPNVVPAVRSQLSSRSFKNPSDPQVDVNIQSVHEAIERGCMAAVQSRDLLNDLDASIGDGDCGSTFARGGKAVLESDAVRAAPSLKEALASIADVAGEAMGGSSGVLLKIFFSAMASELGNDPGRDEIARAVEAGCAKISLYGGATLGDSTMLDSLIPFSKALEAGGTWRDALTEAKAGCEATKTMAAAAGRASYVPTDAQAGVADPGATAVVLILEQVINVGKE